MTPDEALRPRIEAIGLQYPPGINTTLLPAVVGPVTRFNAEGKFIVHKDQPKETAYRQIEWSWEQWNGPYTETVTEIREVPYERYPRTFVPPPSIELAVLSTLDGSTVIASPPVDLQTTPVEQVCHQINLMLEIFGHCDVLREDLSQIIRAPIQRMNWRALPPGQHPWPQIQQQLQPVINGQPAGNQAALTYRLKTVHDHGPDFVAVGEGGFQDYVVFGFTAKNTFVLESPRMDNATYILGSNWQQLSQLTKRDLITGNLITARLIHRNNWATELAKHI